MKSHASLIVDVGSASIGVCIGKLAQDGKPVISHTKRVAFLNASGQNTSALPALAERAIKEGLRSFGPIADIPKTAHVFLAAPWYAAHNTVIASRSDRPIVISRQSIERTIGDYEKEHNERFARGEKIEAAVSQIVVNGYPTALTRPVRGSDLKVHLYESAADAEFLSAVEESIRSAFSGIEVRFHSFPFAAFTVLGALRKRQSFILIDAGAEITDVFVVHRGSLDFFGSFPYGALSFIRTIAGKGSLADAASRASLYVRGELHQADTEKFRPHFDAAAGVWRAEYQKLIESASSGTAAPNYVFLFADRDEAGWFCHILGKTAIPVVQDFFQSSVALGEKTAYDPFLSAEALYALQSKR